MWKIQSLNWQYRAPLWLSRTNIHFAFNTHENTVKFQLNTKVSTQYWKDNSAYILFRNFKNSINFSDFRFRIFYFHQDVHSFFTLLDFSLHKTSRSQNVRRMKNVRIFLYRFRLFSHWALWISSLFFLFLDFRDWAIHIFITLLVAFF